jgi:putative ribosome biogenesis GTPase RsgA
MTTDTTSYWKKALAKTKTSTTKYDVGDRVSWSDEDNNTLNGIVNEVHETKTETQTYSVAIMTNKTFTGHCTIVSEEILTETP